MRQKENQLMCGIFGYAGPCCEAASLVFNGLKELEYRGYDSWGIAVDAGHTAHTVKDVGKLGALPGGLGDAGLVIGLDEGANYLASDVAALLQHTRHIIWLRDGQVASVTRERVSLMDAATGAPIEPVVERIAWDPQQTALGGYQHYLEKEIWEQP